MAFREVKPADIEKKSFEIITEELQEMGKTVDPRYEHIVKRCIHTSADFEYADSLYFSEDVDSKISEDPAAFCNCRFSRCLFLCCSKSRSFLPSVLRPGRNPDQV